MFWISAASSSDSGPIASAADLQRRIADASPGDVLVLGPGNYGYVEIRNAVGITLKSADPTNPAAIGGLAIKAGRDIVLDGLMFDYTFDMSELPQAVKLLNWPYRIAGAKNVTIRNSKFDGDILPDGRKEEVGFPTGTALYVRDCDGFTLENNEIYGFVRGIIVDRSSNSVIRGNDMHGIRMDGMNLVALSTALVENNHIHDFNRSIDSGDHADMIQFWTAGSSTPSTNITIRNNVLNSGSNYYTQSIFMRNEVVDTKAAGKEMFYRNIVIEDNLIVNAHLHGITIGEADGVTIRNNTLIHNRLSDGPANNPQLWIPQINISGGALNVSIVNNISHPIPAAKMPKSWKIAGNLGVQDRDPAAPGWYDAVFANAIGGNPADLANYAYVSGGPAANGTVGVPGLMPDQVADFAAKFVSRPPQWATATAKPATVVRQAPSSEPAMLQAAFDVARDDTFLNRFTFDGDASRAADGSKGLTYEWNFDGQKVTGAKAVHDYAKPGRHEVTLTVKQVDGKTAATSAFIDVPSPTQLEWDATAGQLRGQGPQGMVSVDVPVADSDSGKVIAIDGKPVAVPPDAMAGFFGASDFTLSLRFKTVQGAGAVGEILRVHQAMTLGITVIGAAELQMFTPGGKPMKIKTGPLGLHDGAWHDLTVKYDPKQGKIILLVDGAVKAAAPMQGATPPMRNWGMSFGNGFGQNSFSGQIAALQLRSNEARFAQ